MKNIYLPLLLCTFCAPLFAQTIQNGLVREQNSKRRPLRGVQVTFADAVPTTSDDAGNFRLAFQGKKAGDLIFFSEIKKSGYELVNGKDLEILKIGSSERLGEDIILAKAGTVEAAKKEYYGVSDAALLASFNKEKKALQAQLQQAKINQGQFEDQYRALQEQYDRQKALLDALADKFARINFDDVDSLYRETLELFKAGQIGACKKKLENANLIRRTNLRLQERDRIAGAEAEIARQKADNEKGIQEDIKALKLQTQTYLLSFEFGKAEAIYDQLLRLDSTDLGILQEAADFYREQHRYDKAKHAYSLIIAHPRAEDWHIANAHGSMGELHAATGSLPASLEAYTQCFKAYEKLQKQDSSTTFYKENLAVSYSKLGDTHTALGNLDKALIFFEKGNHLIEKLYTTYPQNVSFKNGLAISYERIGETFTALGNLDKALTYFERYNQLEKELYKVYPQNASFKNGLAISYLKLGETHTALGNLNKALTFFEHYYQIERELYESHPQNVPFKNSLAISCQFLGNTHTSLGNLEKALTFFEQYNQLEKELYGCFPQNVSFKNGLAISYLKLGETHMGLSNLDKALTFFEQCSQLERELYESYPQNVEFKNNLAISCQFLGNAHTSLGNLGKALAFYEQFNWLEKDLYDSYPQNVRFKTNLAISCQYLGEIYTSLLSPEKSLLFFEQGNQLNKELYIAYPQNMEFKNRLAISFGNLGVFYLYQLNDKVKAQKHLQQAEKIWVELVRDAPQHIQFQQFLTKVRQDLEGLK